MKVRATVSGLLATACAVVWAAAAAASPSGVVISQVYGGGGNSGATYTHDFVELYNAGSTSMSLAGWSIQYASATGTSWNVTPLTGSIAAGRYYLIRQAQGAGGTTPLPTADAVGTAAMAAGAGKVALVRNTTAVTGTGCPLPSGAIEDYVGYGTGTSGANCFEGAGPAPTLSNVLAALRGGSGAIDTDSNSTDFVTGAPTPRNSQFGDPGDGAPAVQTVTPANNATEVARTTNLTVTFNEAVDATAGAFTLACAQSGAHTVAVTGNGTANYTLDPTTDLGEGETCTATVHAAGISDVDTSDPPDQMAADFVWSFTTTPPLVIRTIGEVQGAVADTADGNTHRSTFAPPSGNGAGQTVTVRGVIFEKTITRTSAGAIQRGFFIQNLPGYADADATTSDALFVFMGTFTTLIGGYEPKVGDEVVISGRVTEFNFHTQLGSARLERLDRTGVVLDVELPAVVADTPDADRDAVNRYWERRENMRVEVPAGSIANGPRVTFTSTADGEIYVTDPGHPVAQRANPYARRAFRDPHPLDNDPALFDDQNAYRILLGSLGIKGASGDSFELIATAPTFSTLAQRVVGGVYFAFSKWSVQVDAQPQWSAGPDPAANHPPTSPNRALEQTFSDYNVENLYDYRDDPFDGCDFTGNAGCPGVSPPFDYVPASDADYQNRLGLIARQIVEDLHAPDVVMTQEGEDQDICVVAGGQLACGMTNNADGKPDSLQELALRILAIGGPRYDTAYDRNGADARGIVSAFMFRTDRVELLPVTASDPVFGSSPQVVYDTAPLPYNADVQNPKALNAVLPARANDGTGTDGTNVYTRAPQVAAFRLWRNGVGTSVWTDVVAISNHFSSTPQNRVGQRREQALYNARIIDALDEARPLVITAGDFNVFPRPDDPYDPSSPRYPTDQLAPLYEHGLENLWDVELAEAPAAAYSYVFDGNAQTLDQQFVSPALFALLNEARTAHVNADYPQGEEETDTRGLSDHDPMVSQYDAAPTVTKLRALVELYIAQGRVTGNNTARILRDRLDRIEQLFAAGQTDAALSQLQALADQARDMAPTRIDQAAADAIAREAELLKELSA